TRTMEGPGAVSGYTISSDASRLDLHAIHAYLTRESYWARGIPFETVQRAIGNSLCFGVYEQGSGRQVGFARLITDRATFAYLADVYIDTAHRGRGLSKQLVAAVMAHAEVQGLRRWLLATADAHGLYRQFGWSGLSKPERIMERVFPDIYKNPGS
ncbi:MAG TPA: GNAT family N-acetyltransferase, partial [Nevskiaceae bacterium]|nr:GNAT family N-acetyltransferase [Nevskiaceae bacterium]